MIENTAGRTNHYLGAFCQTPGLRPVLDPPIHKNRFQCTGLAGALLHVFEHMVDLLRQFACGRHDKCLRDAARRIQKFEKRQQKSAGLAGSGAGLYNQIGALKNVRNDLFLHGHKAVPSGSAQSRPHLHGQAVKRSVGKTVCDTLLDFLNLAFAMLLALRATGQINDLGVGR